MLPLAVAPGAFLSILDAHVPFLVVLLVAALVLLTRWLDTADRSAYAVGTLCAVVAPAWLLVVLGLAIWDGVDLFGVSGAGLERLVDWAFVAAGLLLYVAVLATMLRPLWATGLFLKASQNTVRRRWKAIESSWQFAIALLVAAAVFRLAVRLLDRLL